MPRSIRIGTRGSHLAMTQTLNIQQRLLSLNNPPEVVVSVIKTSGDINQTSPLHLVSSSDRKGIFTKELEDALLSKEIDIAVHSFKDMPTAPIQGLRIGALPEREIVNDVLIFRKESRKNDSFPFIQNESTIGTSSLRRLEILQNIAPGMKTSMLRGNVPTRVKKVFDKELDAVILAGAGVKRLRESKPYPFQSKGEDWFEFLEVEILNEEIFVPAPAQGTIAIQCRDDDNEVLNYLIQLHSSSVERYVDAERLLLAELEGGCHMPFGAYFRSSPLTVGSKSPSDSMPRTTSDLQLGAESRISEVVAANLFLGKHERNPKGFAFTRKRFGSDADQLAQQLIEELRGNFHIVVTGKKDRLIELENQFGNSMTVIPTIDIESLPVQLSTLQAFTQSDSAVVAASPQGVEILAKALQTHSLQLESRNFYSTGERTTQAILRCFPKSSILAESSNGTALDLAQSILASRVKHIHLLAAKQGTPHLQSRLKESGIDVSRIVLYETKPIPITSEDRNLLSEINKRVIFLMASPSSVDSLLASKNDFDWLFAKTLPPLFVAIGPTTADALRNYGIVPYAISQKPDIETMIKDFL